MLHNSFRRVFLPAIVVLFLLATACGGDSDGSSEGAPTVILEGASRIFLELLNRGLEETYTITYQTPSFEGDDVETYVFVSKPPRTRIQFATGDPSEPSSLIIGDANGAVSCSRGPAEWECFNIEPLGQSLLYSAGPFTLFSPDDLLSFNVREISGRRLTDQDARCFQLLPKQGEEVLEYCFNGDGVPLYSAPLFGNVEAVEFSLEVSDQEFVPPAEPQ